jgi:hypothetical protein
MTKEIDLVEQHILESNSRLRHIDAAMARARSVPMPVVRLGETDLLLKQIEADRNRLAAELEEFKRAPRDAGSDVVARAAGLNGMLKATGRQMEQVLAAIFDKGQ